MRVANGVETIEIETNFRGENEIYHLTLIWDDELAMLVDTGIPRQTTPVLETMKREGISKEHLKKVILTHQDLDHIGGIVELKNIMDHSLEVLAHKWDAPYIEGRKILLKSNPEFLQQVELQIPVNFTEERKRNIMNFFINPPTSKVDVLLKDEDVLPICGGITVIHTPGHTPGHISLYLHRDRILIAGDALMVKNGKLSEPDNNTDLSLARKSIEKFIKYEIDTLICYHGGLVREEVNRQINALVRSFNGDS
jgi:glyoxylase-like metal-dependent hydrolase (beta-lactamase superfamily II)